MAGVRKKRGSRKRKKRNGKNLLKNISIMAQVLNNKTKKKGQKTVTRCSIKELIMIVINFIMNY